MMTQVDDLVYAFEFDGTGQARSIGWAELEQRPSEDDRRTQWMHFDRRSERVRDWLNDRDWLDPIVTEALLAEDTRPRVNLLAGGVQINLRGINLNPEELDEEMISVRIWIGQGRIISCRRLKIMALRDIVDQIEAGRAPKNQGDFIVDLAVKLTARMESKIDEIDEMISDLEDQLIDAPAHAIRRELGAARRRAITHRRFIATQREALSNLITLEIPWLDSKHRERLREGIDRVTRYVEELDVLRERAFVLQDELQSSLSEHMNRTMYVLTVVAGIFLPLSFLTGLLGINVGGIPGVDSADAFWIVTAAMGAIVICELAVFRYFRWI